MLYAEVSLCISIFISNQRVFSRRDDACIVSGFLYVLYETEVMLCRIKSNLLNECTLYLSRVAPETGHDDFYLDALETPLYLSETADI